MLDAIALEKAQTFIDAAGSTRNAENRDELLLDAEEALRKFLEQSAHPRVPEARMQLGRLQMVRGLQLVAIQPDDEKRARARESFVAAAGTFDLIVKQLRESLKEMQGAKIDADQNPDQAALRDRYRGEFLQALSSSGDARFEAAKTYADPAKDGKTLLDEALVAYMDLSEKYDSYVQVQSPWFSEPRCSEPSEWLSRHSIATCGCLNNPMPSRCGWRSTKLDLG